MQHKEKKIKNKIEQKNNQNFHKINYKLIKYI